MEKLEQNRESYAEELLKRTEKLSTEIEEIIRKATEEGKMDLVMEVMLKYHTVDRFDIEENPTLLTLKLSPNSSDIIEIGKKDNALTIGNKIFLYEEVSLILEKIRDELTSRLF